MADFLEQCVFPIMLWELLSHTCPQESACVAVTDRRFNGTTVDLIKSSACGLEQAHHSGI